MAIKLDMVGIVVKDMKQSLEFYRTLGFNIPIEANEEQHVEVNQDGVRLAFDTEEIARGVYGTGSFEKEPTGHRVELAFKCSTANEVNELCALIVEKGYKLHREPWDAFWGQRYAIVVDPDENLISLFA
ncbi:VOC family protein [Bacillus sp. AK128]